MESYSTMEDELLCDTWLAVSVDFIGRSRGGGAGASDSKCMKPFHARKHIAPYDKYIIQECNVSSSSCRCYATQTTSPSLIVWFVSWRQGGHCMRQGTRS